SSDATGRKMRKKVEKMKRVIIIGLALMTISYGGVIFFKKLFPLLLVLGISSVGAGLVLPCVNSLITGSVGKERRGFVTSLYNSVRSIVVAIGPPYCVRSMDW